MLGRGGELHTTVDQRKINENLNVLSSALSHQLSPLLIVDSFNTILLKLSNSQKDVDSFFIVLKWSIQ